MVEYLPSISARENQNTEVSPVLSVVNDSGEKGNDMQRNASLAPAWCGQVQHRQQGTLGNAQKCVCLPNCNLFSPTVPVVVNISCIFRLASALYILPAFS